MLDVDPVRSRLQADDVVLLEADLTTTNQPGWTLMKELGQTAPPVLAVYGPGIRGDTPWMRNAYGSEAVIGALEQARGGTPIARGN
ncbi:MAG: hypothetical protein AAFX79_12435 [Planctomycetota bacterium]